MPVKFLSSPRRALRYSPVTPLGLDERRVDEYLEELTRREQLARHAPLRAERRYERDQHDQPRIHHEPRDLRDTADVLDSVLGGKAQVLVETVAHVVAIEEIGVAAGGREALLDAVGDGGFAGAGKGG